MIQIENVEVFGWAAAIRGMRNPMNSWADSDSSWEYIEDPRTMQTAPFQFHVGPKDEKLMRKLAEAGTDHGKFLRMIHVQCDLVAPFYWYKEMDTYRAGVEKNSCSTMHKIHAREIKNTDFSTDRLKPTALRQLMSTIKTLNSYRALFVQTKLKEYWEQIIQLLPSSYNQRRTYDMSYAALRAMYHARKNHKLQEWRDFCAWCEMLPHAYLITGETTPITGEAA